MSLVQIMKTAVKQPLFWIDIFICIWIFKAALLVLDSYVWAISISWGLQLYMIVSRVLEARKAAKAIFDAADAFILAKGLEEKNQADHKE